MRWWSSPPALRVWPLTWSRTTSVWSCSVTTSSSRRVISSSVPVPSSTCRSVMRSWAVLSMPWVTPSTVRAKSRRSSASVSVSRLRVSSRVCRCASPCRPVSRPSIRLYRLVVDSVS
uniref:Putative secreted protein n=1 Tax=Anopheles darlingi TaxID=43151 RepID=A0A2M4DA74_ANODA